MKIHTVFLDEDKIQSLVQGGEVSLFDEDFRHLIKVLRVKTGEQVEAFDGKGVRLLANVGIIEKRSATVKYISHETCASIHNLDLAVCTPRKETQEEVARVATEFGISNIYFIESEYSQKIELPVARMRSILISSLKQCRNPILPNISYLKWEDFKFERYAQVFVLNKQEAPATVQPRTLENRLLIIGPEGGFSESELLILEKLENADFIQIQAHILRTITAVQAGLGHLLVAPRLH